MGSSRKTVVCGSVGKLCMRAQLCQSSGDGCNYLCCALDWDD